jgi:hypothetical protein
MPCASRSPHALCNPVSAHVPQDFYATSPAQRPTCPAQRRAPRLVPHATRHALARTRPFGRAPSLRNAHAAPFCMCPAQRPPPAPRTTPTARAPHNAHRPRPAQRPSLTPAQRPSPAPRTTPIACAPHDVIRVRSARHLGRPAHWQLPALGETATLPQTWRNRQEHLPHHIPLQIFRATLL